MSLNSPTLPALSYRLAHNMVIGIIPDWLNDYWSSCVLRVWWLNQEEICQQNQRIWIGLLWKPYYGSTKLFGLYIKDKH